MMKMNPEVKSLLVDALESGKYKQGKGALKVRDEYDTTHVTHCCLGVLTELAKEAGIDVREEGPETNGYSGYYTYGERGDYETLPEAVQEWSGLDNIGTLPGNKRVESPGGTCFALAELNDNGMTFDEIANVIKENF